MPGHAQCPYGRNAMQPQRTQERTRPCHATPGPHKHNPAPEQATISCAPGALGSMASGSSDLVSLQRNAPGNAVTATRPEGSAAA
eukprot:302580-Alexandrium_andersonii.AAC.1